MCDKCDELHHIITNMMGELEDAKARLSDRTAEFTTIIAATPDVKAPWLRGGYVEIDKYKGFGHV